MNKTQHSVYTQLAHLGRDLTASSGFVNLPIYHGSTVLYENLDEFLNAEKKRSALDQVTYGRYGTPLSFAFEKTVAQIEGAFAGITTSSGLAAITETLKAFTSANSHLLVSDSVYKPTRAYCDQTLRRYGVETTYYDPLIGSDIEDMVRPNTAMIVLESPGSQTFEIQDIPAITQVAKKHDIVTMIDNTWATPLYLNPFKLGVDISVHAATKYITGHSDAMLGIINATEKVFYDLRNSVRLSGQCAGPEVVFLGLRGLRTMPTRLKQHYVSGLKVAEWLTNRPEVSRVIHPAMPHDPGHSIWKRDFTGAGGLFAFVLNEFTDNALSAFFNRSRLFGLGYSWGGFESLMIPFDPRSYRTATAWESAGQAVRIYIGLEDPDDLIEDLEACFNELHH